MTIFAARIEIRSISVLLAKAGPIAQLVRVPDS